MVAFLFFRSFRGSGQFARRLGVASRKSGGLVGVTDNGSAQTKSFISFDLNNSPIVDGDQDGAKLERSDLVVHEVQPRTQGWRICQGQWLGHGWVRMATAHSIWHFERTKC